MRFPTMLAALCLASSFAGCHSYEPVLSPLPEFTPAQEGRNEMRLTLMTGEQLQLEGAYVAGGAVYGYPLHASSKGASLVSVPLGAIRQAHLRKPHASRTVGYLVGGALIAGTVAASASLAGAARP